MNDIIQDISDPKVVISDHQFKFLREEYLSLKREIAMRLERRSNLVNILLTSSVAYLTTLFVPLLQISGNVSATDTSLPLWGSPQVLLLLYFALILILPFVAFAIEIMCVSETDAITRTGIYIRDNIERRIHSSGYRGWEDWLDRQDKGARRRTSERMADLARRWIIALYCLTSSVIGGIVVSQLSGLSILASACVFFLVYSSLGAFILYYLRKRQNIELTPNFYDVLCIDLDGCLLNSSGSVSRRNADAIKAVQRIGVKVMFATGRSYHGVLPILEELDAMGWHVMSNGAGRFNWPSRQFKTVAGISTSQVGHICGALEGLGVLWAAFGTKQVYCSDRIRDELSDNLRSRGDIPEDSTLQSIENLAQFDWNLLDDEILKIWSYVHILDPICDEKVSNIQATSIERFRTTDETVEFFAAEASKWDGILQILGLYGRETFKVLALGDHDNDKQVMEMADHAVAPANASMSIRNLKSVDIQPATNDEDFVAETIGAYYNLKI